MDLKRHNPNQEVDEMLLDQVYLGFEKAMAQNILVGTKAEN